MVGLWFLGSALPFIYLYFKFYLNTNFSFQVICRTRYRKDGQTKRQLYAFPFGEHKNVTKRGPIYFNTFIWNESLCKMQNIKGQESSTCPSTLKRRFRCRVSGNFKICQVLFLFLPYSGRAEIWEFSSFDISNGYIILTTRLVMWYNQIVHTSILCPSKHGLW